MFKKIQNKKFKFINLNLNTKSLGGFTLVETIVAIFIFMIVITAFLSLSGQILLQTKSQRFDMTAQYLLQEGVEYIRNNRDSALNSGATWTEYTDIPGICPGTVGTTNVKSICPCLSSTDGCSIDPLYDEIKACSGSCPATLEVNNSNGPSFYCTGMGTYCLGTNNLIKTTTFKRTVKITPAADPNEIYVDVILNWVDVGGSNRTKTLKTTLFNW